MLNQKVGCSPSSENEIERIAIIGIGCRFPGSANSPESFWKLLRNGIDAITEVPADRWDLDTFYDPDPAKPGKIKTRWGGFIEKIDEFDANFFGISPREASRIDPQQRLLLEVAWEALEDGGQMPEQLTGTNTGVFIGIYTHDYEAIQLSSQNRDLIDSYTNTGWPTCFAANRISYFFDFRGPSIALDTACSSSLVAVHLACNSIWNGESAMALAGGVNIILRPEPNIGLSVASMLAPDGRCKTFDAKANGFVRSEGAGIVVLKLLSQAIADGDPIYAVIRGSAVNQDGRTNGMTVPSREAQEAMLWEVYQRAGISPGQVQYIETHGTGTPVGDPIEANALGNVLVTDRAPNNYCHIGSVKTNIGHLETASGIAGLIKVALSLKHQEIPPNLNFLEPNPQINFEKLQLQVQQKLETWTNNEHCPRIAGVNSFGLGGTNAHTVLEEAPQVSPPVQNRQNVSASLLTLSAHSPEALQTVVHKYLELLAGTAGNEVSLQNICYTASLRRGHHDHRLVLVAHSQKQLIKQLEAFLVGVNLPGMSAGRKIFNKQTKLAFVFSGMGQQWWAMGRQLWQEEPVFQAVIKQCDALLLQAANWSLVEELTASEETSRINETEIAQPIIFAVQVALAALYRSWGICPDVIVGHSVGEVAAAHVAGVLSIEDAIQVIFHRSRVQAKIAGTGKMLAVGLSSEEAERKLTGYEDRVSIAAINSSRSVTISGDSTALEEIAKSLEAQQIFNQFLRVELPYHSPFIEPLKPDLVESLQLINPQKATILLFSTVTGQQVEGSELDATYWGQNMRNPVLFAAAIDKLVRAGYDLFLEISARPVLASSVSESFSSQNIQGTVVPSLRQGEPGRATMLEVMGKLYTLGYSMDWHGLYPEGGQFVRLPSYPWQRERFWNESEASKDSRLAAPIHPLLGRSVPGLHPSWQLEDPLRFSYLKDHQIQSLTVFPGAGYVEMALAATAANFGKNEGWLLKDIKIQKMLVLSDKPRSLMQVLLSPGENEEWLFEIASRPESEKDSWTVHAVGTLSRESSLPVLTSNLSEAQKQCLTSGSVQDLYRNFLIIGLEYGKYFQGIQQFWLGDEEALAQIEVKLDVKDYWLHPAILDACFQTLLLAVPGGLTSTYLPVSIKQVKIYGQVKSPCFAHAILTQNEQKTIEGNILVFDAVGNIFVEIQGLCGQSLGEEKKTQSSNIDDYFYEEYWQEKQSPFPNTNIIAGHILAQISRWQSELNSIQQVEEFSLEIDKLCAAYVRKAFAKLGFQSSFAEEIDVPSLMQQLKIAPQHHRFVNRLWSIAKNTDSLAPGTYPQSLFEKIWNSLPFYHLELTILKRIGEYPLADILQNPSLALQILFQDDILKTWYEVAITNRPHLQMIAEALSQALKNISTKRVIRILEVGAGTGALTSYLLPLLTGYQVEYVFTDISASFFVKAKERFREFSFVKYKTLDLEKDAISQGYQKHYFDIIFAYDALHTTKDLSETLQHLQSLLVPGGWLAALEVTDCPIWVDIVFGCLEGWWRFVDTDLRPSHATLSRKAWENLLQTVGFVNISTIANKPEGESVHSILLAQKLEIIPVYNLEKDNSWVIFTDSQGLGNELENILHQAEQKIFVVSRGEKFQKSDETHLILSSDHVSDMQTLLKELPEVRNIVHLWSLDDPESSLMSVVNLVKALIETNLSEKTHIWLVTKGAQMECTFPEQSPLVGLGRTIVNECPELKFTMVDLESENSARTLFDAMGFDNSEPEMAFRQGVCYVPRLIPTKKEELSRSVSLDAQEAFRLEMQEPGLIDRLTFCATKRKKPASGQVEVKVFASGVSFNDVVFALGMHPDPAFHQSSSDIVYSLGKECAGKVVAVGEGVNEFAVGDDVIAMGSYCFGSFVTTSIDLVIHKPAHLTYEEAASIPGIFLTVYYAFHHLARILPGERVLIHSAAGGVGQAAIQLAQMMGAEIFATVGTSEKRAFLRYQGVKHIMDSHTLSWAEEIMKITSGKGVDVVLNSLAGEAISKGISVLSHSGRFLEIGIRDIFNNSQIGLLPFQRNLSFFAIDLYRIAKVRTPFIKSMLRDVIALFESKQLKPVPINPFPLSDAVNAFRFMTRGKHIGKIVLNFQSPQEVLLNPSSELFLSDATYLITGGLGGFGLALVEWMVEKGARYFVLVGRSGICNKQVHRTIQGVENKGAKVVVAQGDVSQQHQLASILNNIAQQNMPPLRGIFHLAMVLDDDFIVRLNSERFQQVMAPKATGAWNLHKLTEQMPLDFFVLFSSLSALAGNPQQANYVAASVFLDALAHHRRLQGLAGISINWGVLAEVGAVARSSRRARVQAEKGWLSFSPQQAFAGLEYILRQNPVQQCFMNIDWQAITNIWGKRERFSHLCQEFTVEVGAATAIANENQESLEVRLGKQVAVLLGTLASKIDIHTPLNRLGLDSLMTFELKTWLEKNAGINVSQLYLMEGATVALLAEKITPDASEKKGWIVRFRPNHQARLRLFCFPYGAGVASIFESWPDYLPPDVEVCGIQLPGRETLNGIPLISDMDHLLQRWLPELLPLLDVPFVFYGHSLGGLLSFEMARCLRKQHQLSPVHLFVGGTPSPQVFPSALKKIFGHEKLLIESMPDEQWMQILVKSKILNKPTLSMASIARADILLVRNAYEQEAPFDFPITAFIGEKDEVLTNNQVILAWGEQTTKRFSLQTVPGNHLFIDTNKELFLPILSAALTDVS